MGDGWWGAVETIGLTIYLYQDLTELMKPSLEEGSKKCGQKITVRNTSPNFQASQICPTLVL